jgi:hypothetical protein
MVGGNRMTNDFQLGSIRFPWRWFVRAQSLASGRRKTIAHGFAQPVDGGMSRGSPSNRHECFGA